MVVGPEFVKVAGGTFILNEFPLVLTEGPAAAVAVIAMLVAATVGVFTL
jgi:hypothetical protein